MRTELVINGTRVDLSAELQVSLNYAIADIKNPDKRVGSFSRTVVLPGTPVIDKLLGGIFEINLNIQNTTITNFTPDFNPNLKADIVVYCDTIEQFRGYMRLRKVIRERNLGDKISYEVELYGELGSFIQKLGDAKLTDLDFSEHNHTYNRTNQRASWISGGASGYVYPMINYGTSDGVNWKVEDFKPSIFHSEILDKIFNYAGFVYSSTFLTSTPFTRLCIPFTGEKLSLDQTSVTNRKFSANTTLDTTVGGINTPFLFNNEVSDPDGQYDPLSGYFTCVSPGYYEFVQSGTFYWTANGGNVINVAAGAWLNVLIYKYEAATATTTLITGIAVHNDFTSILSGNQTASVTYTVTSNTTLCKAGDKIWIKLLPTCPGALTSGTSAYLDININAGATFSNTVNDPSVVEGATVDMNTVIPTDIRMADFFMAIVKEFNLMVEPDRVQSNKLYIETADNFYGSGTTRDWSLKLDRSKPLEIYPMGALDARRYTLKRKDGEDDFSQKYIKRWGETYGQKNHDVNNDFLKDVNVFESIFTDLPIVGRTADDRVYPELYTTDTDGTRKPVTSGIRQMYWAGEVNTGYAWNYVTDGGTYTETTYPYAGHIDDVSNPTLDLCFNVPKEVYYNTTVYTDGNLWNKYHKKYIEEITDKDSKIVIGYFYLKAVDIYKLSFRDQIFVDGTYYRLQKVVDYNPAVEGVTKVELLKIKNANTFTPRTFDINNWTGSTASVGITVSRPNDGGLIAGTTNYVDRNSGNLISGERNGVGAGTRNVFIAGSSGVTVYPELSNVVVINTHDITVTQSNTVYINGSSYSGGANSSYNVSTSQTITGAGTYYCTGTITLTMSTSVVTSGDVIQIFNMGTGTLTIAGGGINILQSPATSSASITSSTRYDSITLRYNGTNYIVQ